MDSQQSDPRKWKISGVWKRDHCADPYGRLGDAAAGMSEEEDEDEVSLFLDAAAALFSPVT